MVSPCHLLDTLFVLHVREINSDSAILFAEGFCTGPHEKKLTSHYGIRLRIRPQIDGSLSCNTEGN